MLLSLNDDSLLDKLFQFIPAGAIAERLLQIDLVVIEKAGSQLPIGGEAKAIAGIAKMLGHRADETDGAPGSG